MHQGRLSREGRVLIPAELRRAVGLAENDAVSIYAEDGEIRIVGRLQAIRRMQERMAKYKKPGVSVVDELLAERREEAARE
jgi:AbrB family looped-hinge helix DNA binding protein